MYLDQARFRKIHFRLAQIFRKDLASYVNADEEDLVIVENASDGANAVLKSLGANLPLKQVEQLRLRLKD